MMVKKGYKITQLGPTEIKIPKAWKIKNLNDITKINMGSSPPSKTYNENKKGLPFFQGNAEFSFRYPQVKLWCSKPQKIANKNDILISVRAPVGELNIAPFKCCIGRGLASIDGEKAINRYIYYLLKQFKYLFESYSQGSTFSSINKKILKSFQVPLPPLPEQKKIASILSTVDNAIEKTDEIIEETKKLKKGLMQELLTKGIGHDEFKEVKVGPKDLNIPIDWQVMRIDQIKKDKKNAIKVGPFGSQLKKEDLTTEGKKVYGQENVMKNDFSIGYRHLDEEKYEELKTCRIFTGDILVTMMGSVGSSAVFPDNAKKGILDSHLLRIQVKEDICLPKYVSKIIDESYFVNFQINSYSHGAIMSGLNSKIVKQLRIPIPPLQEQKKIASILSSVDNKIQKEQEYKEQLQQLKKGLMQKLLTGKIRVKVDKDEED